MVTTGEDETQVLVEQTARAAHRERLRGPHRTVAEPTCAVHNRAVETVRFARSARKHRVGRAHVVQVIDTTVPKDVPAVGEFDPRKVWVGVEDRGLELEIVAVVLPGELLIIHVMPTALRRKR